jgi:pyruvate formate lyase activating enzyme
VEEVLAEVLRDRLTYETSGGGVTFSGGEPLAQPDFLAACLEACRRSGLHTAVDTCGFAPREVALGIAGRTDLVLFDLKSLDPERHRALTGAPLEPILGNLAAIAGAGVPIWLRLPVIPGLNDGEDDLRAAARLAATTPGVERVSLLPYHRTGTGKLGRLGRPDALAEGPLPSPAPPPAGRLRALARIFEAEGLDTRIGG